MVVAVVLRQEREWWEVNGTGAEGEGSREAKGQ
jgi:hypothetical protein